MFYLLFFRESYKYYDDERSVKEDEITDQTICVLIQNEEGKNFLVTADFIRKLGHPVREIAKPTFSYTLREFLETKKRVLSIQKNEVISGELLEKINRFAVVMDDMALL